MVTWVPGTPLGGVTEEIVAVLTGKGTEFVDTVARLLPGVLGNEAPSAFEWFQDTGHGEGLLDCPHWTARRSSADGRRRKFCWAAITRRFGSFGGGSRGRRRSGCARIC